jgi:hypothetical protein
VNSSEFFSLIVKPTAEEYLRERYDIRRGCLAAIVLNQMADYCGSRTVSDSEQISRPPGIFQAPFGTALFREAIVVNVALDDGSVRVLHDAVISVLSMWSTKINQRN